MGGVRGVPWREAAQVAALCWVVCVLAYAVLSLLDIKQLHVAAPVVILLGRWFWDRGRVGDSSWSNSRSRRLHRDVAADIPSYLIRHHTSTTLDNHPMSCRPRDCPASCGARLELCLIFRFAGSSGPGVDDAQLNLMQPRRIPGLP